MWHGINLIAGVKDGLELDFFLLQCCSVMAPPEEFVEQIQAHFGLTDCVSLVLQCPNEYGILSNFNHFQGLLFCTLECDAQVCNRLQEVSTTALLETAIGAAVADRDNSWCLEEFMIFWPLLFHATCPQNLSNSKEPQGLLIHSTPLAGFKIWMFVQQLKTRQKWAALS